jgi:hypothetical protein
LATGWSCLRVGELKLDLRELTRVGCSAGLRAISVAAGMDVEWGAELVFKVGWGFQKVGRDYG